MQSARRWKIKNDTHTHKRRKKERNGKCIYNLKIRQYYNIVLVHNAHLICRNGSMAKLPRLIPHTRPSVSTSNRNISIVCMRCTYICRKCSTRFLCYSCTLGLHARVSVHVCVHLCEWMFLYPLFIHISAHKHTGKHKHTQMPLPNDRMNKWLENIPGKHIIHKKMTI